MMTKYKISTAFALSTIRAGLTIHLILVEGKVLIITHYIYSIEPVISHSFYPNLYFATLSKIRIFGKIINFKMSTPSELKYTKRSRMD